MVLIFFLLATSIFGCAAQDESSIKIVAPDQQAMVVMKLYASGCNDPISMAIINQIAMHLGLSQQFAVSVQFGGPLTTKQEFRTIAGSSTAIVLYFHAPQPGIFEWRILDGTAGDLLSGKKSILADRKPWQLATDIADQIWQTVTGSTGDFSTLVIACKANKTRRGRYTRSIHAFNPTFGSQWEHVQPLVTTRTDNFAPRPHPSKPLIYYSQHTPLNIRLMSVDAEKNSRVITNFDGQNLTPAVNSKGEVVVCLSNNGSTHLYMYKFDPVAKKGEFVQLTRGNNHYMSPSFADDNTIICASIDQKCSSSIVSIDCKTQHIKPLALGKAFCPAADGQGRIAYCKKHEGRLQVWVYNTKTGRDTVITNSASDKDEPCWSPSRNKLAVACDDGKTKRIAIVDLDMGKERYITPVGENWSFPAWVNADTTAELYNS